MPGIRVTAEDLDTGESSTAAVAEEGGVAEPLHLWEYDHPYYCSEGNFYKSGHADRFDSWQDFKDQGMYGADRDLNLLFRWDWYRDGERHDLLLFFVLQRKAILRSQSIRVTEADEPEVRAWLAACARTTAAIWEPLVTLPAPEATP